MTQKELNICGKKVIIHSRLEDSKYKRQWTC